MDVSNRRIVILGKTGAGKSSLANTIFGEQVFKTSYSLNSETRKCQAETRSVNGRRITLIATPGFYDTDGDEDKLKPEIVRCITECAPGPHAFLIVLKVEKFTQQEKEVINKINEYFSEEVFRYAIVLFTHGAQLKGKTIEEFVSRNKSLSDLVRKCGGRCHVIDNEYWRDNPNDDYRSNEFQVEKLLNTIDEVTEANKGGYYTNEMLQAVQKIIEQEKTHIRKSSGKMSEEEITQKARDSAYKKIWIRLAGVGTGAVLGALCGVAGTVRVALLALKELGPVAKSLIAAAGVAAAGAAAAAGVLGTAGIALLSVTVVSAAVGAGMGGLTGYHAAEGADTPREAAKMAAAAVKEEAQSVIDGVRDCLNDSSKPSYSKLNQNENP